MISTAKNSIFWRLKKQINDETDTIKNNTFEIQLEYATKFILSNLNNANEYSIEHSALEKETTRCGVIYSHRITINN